MIINAFAVLDGFLSFLRIPASLVVIGLAVTTWNNASKSPTVAESRSRENQWHLLILLSTVLLGLNVAAWPVFYALLQSYVPQWPGVMCIYGVMRIGVESQGISRFLPTLLTTLQATKPAVVFMSGAWLVLYFLNRRTSSSRLMPRVLVLIAVFGLLSVADAVLEVTYLVIPKKEQFLEAGCCTTSSRTGDDAGRLGVSTFLGSLGRGQLLGAYYGLNGLIVAGLLSDLSLTGRLRNRWSVPLLLVGAILSALVNWTFLVQIAAPAILRLPYHHCPYDLLTAAPESVAGIVLFLLGCFSIGWACVATWMGRDIETQTAIRSTAERLHFLALFGYIGSVIVFSVEMALA